jgi:hypothetical protein
VPLIALRLTTREHCLDVAIDVTEITFYARGDSSTANNPDFNVLTLQQQPVIQITFTSDTTGDIKLDYNGGLPDPDTQVIVGNDPTPQNFIVYKVGYLPSGTSKVPLALQGQRVVVISVNGKNYFFVPDMDATPALLAQIGNGSITLTNVSTDGGPVLICFVAGTSILTPDGERPVESLRAGDRVCTIEGHAPPLLWIGHRRVTPDELARWPNLAPVTIARHAFGHDRPARPLAVSPQHRILVEGWPVELAVGAARGLVSARHLLDTPLAARHPVQGPVDYYHLLFERPEIVISNGLPTESLQPQDANLRDIDAETLAELALLFPEGIPAPLAARAPAAPALRGHESRVVAAAIT